MHGALDGPPRSSPRVQSSLPAVAQRCRRPHGEMEPPQRAVRVGESQVQGAAGTSASPDVPRDAAARVALAAGGAATSGDFGCHRTLLATAGC